MAFSDWTAFGGGSIVTPLAGTAVLNSGLANPLTVGSTYCRRFTAQSSSGSAEAILGISASASYAGGALVNVPDSKAIRLQSYLRLESAPSSLANYGAWLAAKHSSPNPIFHNLYALGIKVTVSGVPQLSLVQNGAAITSLGAAVFAQWYGLRLDVFPIGTAADRLIAYKETTPGSGTWTVLADVTIPSTSAGYVPWSQDRKNGLYFLGQPNSGSPTVAYADLTTVAVGNAPVPVP
jgi:hypothetical protein